MLAVQGIPTTDYVTKPNLPFCDYVINPYAGCTHGCKYCYARFMKRFTGHTEEWGSLTTLSAAAAAVTDKLHAAVTALRSEIRRI